MRKDIFSKAINFIEQHNRQYDNGDLTHRVNINKFVDQVSGFKTFYKYWNLKLMIQAKSELPTTRFIELERILNDSKTRQNLRKSKS